MIYDAIKVDNLVREAKIKASLFNVTDGLTFIKSIKPAEWLMRGFLIRNYLYTLTSPTNHGKTTLICGLICAAIKGEKFGVFPNALKRPLNVLLLCGENDIDTGIKLIASKNAYGVHESAFRKNLRVVRTAFQMSVEVDALAKEINAAGIDYDLVICDTWQAYWSGGDFNSNDAQLDHARAMRKLTTLIKGSPACLVPAHPVKNASRDNLVPYGGGAAMNEIDGNFTSWLDNGVIELSMGKRRQAPFESVAFELTSVTIPELPDDEGIATSSVIVEHLPQHLAERAKEQSANAEEAFMRLMLSGSMPDGAAITVRSLMDALSVKKNFVERLISTHRSAGHATKSGRLMLTKSGQAHFRKMLP